MRITEYEPRETLLQHLTELVLENRGQEDLWNLITPPLTRKFPINVSAKEIMKFYYSEWDEDRKNKLVSSQGCTTGMPSNLQSHLVILDLC